MTMTAEDEPMLIAQITDLHLVGPDVGLRYGIDANANVAEALVRIQSLDPRPDLIIATGDLTDHGSDEEYEVLVALIDSCEIPLLLVAGNHDERSGLTSHFPDHDYLQVPMSSEAGVTDSRPPLHWVVDDYSLRIIGLDSTIPGRQDGSLDHECLLWLDGVLSDCSELPTVIAVHHPPFETGIWWMDRGALLSGGPGLREVIGNHPQVIRILSGHIHRPIMSNWGGTVLSVCPSTAYQVHLDLGHEAPPRLNNEAAAFQLHSWNGSELITHTMPVHPEPGVRELSGS